MITQQKSVDLSLTSTEPDDGNSQDQLSGYLLDVDEKVIEKPDQAAKREAVSAAQADENVQDKNCFISRY